MAKKGKNNELIEDRLIAAVDILSQCKREINTLKRIVKAKDFATNLKKQNQVALISRGIFLKMQSLDAVGYHVIGELDPLRKTIAGLARNYGKLFDTQQVALQVTGKDGGPIEHDHTVKGEMNIKGLQDAIKRDQET